VIEGLDQVWDIQFRSSYVESEEREKSAGSLRSVAGSRGPPLNPRA
jgi:hypothetical protein